MYQITFNQNVKNILLEKSRLILVINSCLLLPWENRVQTIHKNKGVLFLKKKINIKIGYCLVIDKEDQLKYLK